MMSKIKILYGAVWMFTIAIASAQTSTATVNGSPYLDEKYVEGTIYYANKTLAAPIRYNAYQDLIEYKNGAQALVLDPSTTINKVCFGNSTFVPLQAEGNSKGKLGYFMLLDSGKAALYARKKIIYQAAKKGGALDGSDLPAQFKPSPDAFYIKLGDDELQQVGNMKSMIASFPDKQEELIQFAKKEKISPRKEKDIAAFIKYYNAMFDPTAVSAARSSQ